jgi:cysteine dioxygenase
MGLQQFSGNAERPKMNLQTSQANLCSMEEFAHQLASLPEPSFDNVQSLLQVIRTRSVDPDTLAPYLSWDKQHYTRNLIHKTDLFALMAICWEPGQGSSIHDHRGQNCWMVVPIGRLQVQNYRVLFERVDEGKCALETTDTIEMNATAPAAVDPLNPVHCVYNPAEFKQRAVSLHVYSRPFDECVVYSEERGTCGVINLEYTTEYGHAVKQGFTR